ncbi:conserved hypothetical protein [Microsporum canis CBS 113480]|uniref:Uncharacterized protein n=1 Tax=Arthroderma otae (strain ATCC MYA-4605 / CBS 113480) TaxID=554155 RepID=C5FCE0_ARTOC|nr:conserved hypothetical protein [Microsporum canis CBS 113480]EEQ27384.1 conserved hypothetical protein [Microsporum canis CBS 113480]
MSVARIQIPRPCVWFQEQTKIEEKSNPGSKAELFYPNHVDDIFNFESKYQVVVKLGYGTASMWLCLDLVENLLLTLKVCIAAKDAPAMDNELTMSQHLDAIDTDHPGEDLTFKVLKPVS